MTGHGKGEPGWIDRNTLNASQDQCARIHDRRQDFQPGLCLVLRAVVGQGGIRQVALQDVRAPLFPIMQQQPQFLDILASVIAAQQFRCTCWGTCSRVQ